MKTTPNQLIITKYKGLHTRFVTDIHFTQPTLTNSLHNVSPCIDRVATDSSPSNVTEKIVSLKLLHDVFLILHFSIK